MTKRKATKPVPLTKAAPRRRKPAAAERVDDVLRPRGGDGDREHVADVTRPRLGEV